MLKSSHYLTLLAWVFALAPLAAQLTISPENPLPGETVELTYDPAGTVLEGVPNIDTRAYFFTLEGLQAFDVRMVPDGKCFRGKVKLLSDTRAVMLSITNDEQELRDDNNKTGYKFYVYEPNRTTPRPGAVASKSLMYSTYYRLGGIDANKEKALNLLKTEFRTHPSSMDNTKYFQSFASLAKTADDKAVTDLLEAKYNELTQLRKPTEEQLALAIALTQNLDQTEARESLTKKYNRKFPAGQMVQRDVRAAFYDAETLEEKESIFADYQKSLQKAGITNDDQTGRLASNLAGEYADRKDWENFAAYLDKIPAVARQAGLLNSIAWKLSGESLDAEAEDAARGLQYSEQSLKLMEEAMDKVAEIKPDQYTENQWRQNLEMTRANYADTYALLAYKEGKFPAALEKQRMACEARDFSDGEMNERYAVYLEKVEGGPATEQFLTEMIEKGAATAAMKDQHRRLFIANNTVESAYEKYVAELEKTAERHLRAELSKKMMEEEAPAFALRNLDGNEVSLASLKGKVVVVDFWATWCGPCKASFPGMQKAVNKYADRDDVEFVFIDTWERVANKQENAGSFIASNGYTFNVLLDNDNEVVEAFGVSGIPTKFVLDKDGKIRFKSVGFGGNDDELVSELSLMIEMASDESPDLTGAP